MTIVEGHLTTPFAMRSYGVGRTKFFRLMRAHSVTPVEAPGLMGRPVYHWPMAEVMMVRAKEAELRARRQKRKGLTKSTRPITLPGL